MELEELHKKIEKAYYDGCRDTKKRAKKEIDELFDFDHTKKFKPSIDRNKCKFCKLKYKILEVFGK